MSYIKYNVYNNRRSFSVNGLRPLGEHKQYLECDFSDY